MNKLERRLKGEAKFKKRLENIGITSQVINEWKRKGVKYNLNCYKSTGKPCSCASCSPNKRKEVKAKYKQKYKNKFDE
jgi:hypothetical protein